MLYNGRIEHFIVKNDHGRKMGYFDDIQFIAGDVIPTCRSVLDQRFPGTCSLEFLRSGCMSHGIDQAPPVILKEPAVFWHHPRHSYQYGAVDDKGWHHHWVLMKGERARRFVEEGLCPLSKAGFVPVRRASVVADLMCALIKSAKAGAAEAQGERVVLLERILCVLQQDIRAGSSPARHRAEIDKVVRRIDKDPFGYNSPEYLAAEAHLSYSQFRRLFRAQVGYSPHSYVLLARMRKAGLALEKTDRQVKDIAASFGYEDPAQFCKVFKSKIGLSPESYRRAFPVDIVST